MTSTNSAMYVFDSGPLIDLKNYPRDIFPTIWNQLEKMFSDGQIISCYEVFREIENYDDTIAEWAKEHKEHFSKPSIDEQNVVATILRRHPELVRQNNIVSGKPVADPFVIAQAFIHKRSLVHREKAKPNAHNIPTVCASFNVPNLNLFEFFRQMNWSF